MPATPKSTFRSGKVLRYGLYMLFLLAFQEAALRVCFPLPEIKNLDRINYVQLSGPKPRYARNEARFWESAPDTEGVFLHEMNRYGFRGQEWRVEKPEGKKRVLFIGDSFVEGIMAGQGQTIPEGFAAAAGVEKYEVMNAGMVGQGLSAYLQLLADLVPIFQPDAVVFCIYANDLGQKAPAVPEFFLEPEHCHAWTPRFLDLLRESRSHGPVRAIWDTRPRAYLPAVPASSSPWTQHEAELSPQVDPQLSEQMKAGTFNPFRTNALAQEERHLKQEPRLGETIPFLKYVCKQNQVRPLVVYIPSRNQVTRHYYQYERQFCRTQCPDSLDLTTAAYQGHQVVLAQSCQQFGLEFLDTSPLLREKEAQGQHLFWNYDEHMKGAGYLLLGREIAAAWERNPR